jgi:hypothetical protein
MSRALHLARAYHAVMPKDCEPSPERATAVARGMTRSLNIQRFAGSPASRHEHCEP